MTGQISVPGAINLRATRLILVFLLQRRLANFLPTTRPTASATTDMPPAMLRPVASCTPTLLGGSAAPAASIASGVRLGRRVIVGVGIGVGLDVYVGDGVKVGVNVGVGVLVGVGVNVGVEVLVGVIVGVDVGIGVFVGAGVLVGLTGAG
jgi:UDP-3-O-[3-hydroxymyristoyl] glucosamine N-acyltransferase